MITCIVLTVTLLAFAVFNRLRYRYEQRKLKSFMYPYITLVKRDDNGLNNQ